MMNKETEVWKIDRVDQLDRLFPEMSATDATEADNGKRMRAAAQMVQQGKLVAFPTETVYGLGADARQDNAVAAIFEAKGRPSDNPLIVHIAAMWQLSSFVARVSSLEERLMHAFWPGPLTLVLPVKPNVISLHVTAGLDTVAVRIPDHPIAQALLEVSGCPIAAPSANRSGRPSPTLAAHVLEDLAGRIDGLLDGGATGVGLESTVVQVDADGYIHILRPGGVTAEQLAVFGPLAGGEPLVASTAAPSSMSAGAPRSPGVKYAHYAPQGEMELVQGAVAAVQHYICAQAARWRQVGSVTAVLAFSEHAHVYRAHSEVACVAELGSLQQLDVCAARLYAALRELDAAGAQRIWAEACPETGIGVALLNRLRKAAGERIVQV